MVLKTDATQARQRFSDILNAEWARVMPDCVEDACEQSLAVLRSRGFGLPAREAAAVAYEAWKKVRAADPPGLGADRIHRT